MRLLQEEFNEMARTEAIIERLKIVVGVKTSTQLAEKIGVNRPVISTWKARKKIPYEACEEVSKQYSVSLEWLLSGTGDMKPQSGQADSPSIDPQSQKMLELYAALTDSQRREICSAAEEKKRLNEIEKLVQELRDEKSA